MKPSNLTIKQSSNSHRGFTLVEMLVVIGIITVLVGATVASFSKLSKTAENTRAQELVSQAATALAAIYEADGVWPKKIRDASKSSNGKLDNDNGVALILAKRGYMSLTTDKGKTKLVGKDQFGVVSPWAQKLVDQFGSSASGKKVGTAEFNEHILSFAVDLDGDGKITSTESGSRIDEVRATAAVWCPKKDGKPNEKIQSWTKGQTEAVN